MIRCAVRCIWLCINKSISLMSGFLWTVVGRAKVLGLWEKGRGLRFEGVLHLHSLRGLVVVGDNVKVGRSVGIGVAKGAKLTLGNNVTINCRSLIVSNISITIGDNCIFGEGLSLRDADHVFERVDVPIRMQGMTAREVVIGEDVWAGSGVTICKGVTIGEGCVLGAGAVVTRDIPPFCVAVGSPAKVIKRRGQP